MLHTLLQERSQKTFYFVYPKSSIFVPDTEKCPFLWLLLLHSISIMDYTISPVRSVEALFEWLYTMEDSVDRFSFIGGKGIEIFYRSLES